MSTTPPPVPQPRNRKTTGKTGTTGTTESKGTPRDVPPLPPTPEKTPPEKRTPADRKLAGSIRGMYEGLGMLSLQFAMATQDPRFAQFGNTLMGPELRIDFTTGQSVPVEDPRTGADKITDAWMALAERNPRVKDALKRFTEGGAFAEVIILHATLVYPFLPGIPGLARFLPGQYPPRTQNGAHAN